MPGAKFCTSCGWPLVQPCPIECGNDALPLLTQGEPTKACPKCRQVLKHCVTCGRLHAATAQQCLNGCGHTLVFPFDTWTGESGSSFGTVRVTAERIQPVQTPHALSTNLQAGVLVGPVATAGYLFVAHAGLVRRWRVGDEGEDTIPVSAEAGPHALVAGQDAVYFASKDELAVIDANTFRARQTLRGAVVRHLASREGWFGLVRTDAGLKLRVLVGQDPADFDSPILESDVLGLFGSPGPLLLVGASGSLTSFEHTGPVRNVILDKGVAHAWCDDDRAYVLDRAGVLHVLDRRTLVETALFPLISESATCPPIFCGNTGYLFTGEHHYTVFDKQTGSRKDGSHGFGRITQACSVCTQSGSYAVITSVEGNTQSVQCFNLEGSARIAKFFSADPRAILRFAVAEGSVHVAHSSMGDVRIRSYALV